MSELSKNLSELKNEAAAKEKLGAIANLLDRNNINLEEVGKITKVSLYQTASKDAEGDVQVTDLVGVQISPKWAEGPEWPVIQPAKPTVIKPSLRKKAPALVGGWKKAVILPDPQIGFRWVNDELNPFHDDRAMDVALQVLAVVQHESGVDKVINLGDYLDLPTHGRFVQEPAFALTTQHALDRGHEFLAQQRATAPYADLVLIEGNHDKRMNLAQMATANAAASFGLRRANVPDSWPVMSVPYLLRLDELNVEFIDAYPAGQYWINDKVRCIHGDKVRSGGSSAAMYVKDYPGISTIFGHCHRIEKHHQTKLDRHNPVRTFAASPGCLCRIDGAVPSYNSGVHSDGTPAVRWEDWQQGMGILTYHEDGRAFYDDLQIVDGQTIYRDQVIVANELSEVSNG